MPAGNDITITTTGTNHPTMSSTYNAHVQFYEPNSRTTRYCDAWFGQDCIGATFQGCASGTRTITTKIVGQTFRQLVRNLPAPSSVRAFFVDLTLRQSRQVQPFGLRLRQSSLTVRQSGADFGEFLRVLRV